MAEEDEDASANSGPSADKAIKAGYKSILPSQVRLQARGYLANIWENWTTLGGILERHEVTIQRRWMNKSKFKRQQILLIAWPGMAAQHNQHIVEAQNKDATPESGRKRDWFMFPYINLEDLKKAEPLLLMINSRGRHHPGTFAARDLQCTLFGLVAGHLHRPYYLDNYFMKFDVDQPRDAYGQLLRGLCKYVEGSGDTRLSADGRYMPGDGLWVLEIQDRIYSFLLAVIKEVLHDIPFDSLCGPVYPVQPEPPLVSADGKGMSTLAVANLEAAYLPTAQLDFTRIISVIEAKLRQIEDKIASLREDPGYFSSCLVEYIAHKNQFIPYFHGFALLSHKFPIPGAGKDDLEKHFVNTFMCYTLHGVEVWASLRDKVAQVIKQKSQMFDGKGIKPSDPLPRKLALAFYKLYAELVGEISGLIKSINTEIYVSEPFRPYFRRAGYYMTESQEIVVYHARTKPLPPQLDHVLILIQRLERYLGNPNLGHIAGVQASIEAFDQLPRETARAAISSRISEHLSSLAIVSECLRQVQLFQPWAATFDSMRKEEQNKLIVDRATTPEPRYSLRQDILGMGQALKNVVYPAEKARSKENVDAMRTAEAALDKFWAAVLDQKARFPLGKHCRRVLSEHTPRRTPEWVEPTKANKMILNEEYHPPAMPLGEFHVDSRPVKPKTKPVKLKVKTRGKGTPLTEPEDGNSPREPSAQTSDTTTSTVKVDRRSLHVFRQFFYTPSAGSQPGEVPWADFLHAMQSAGFLVEKLYGSVWQFTATEKIGAANARRNVLFHEPHPSPKISFWKAREYGRRLTRRFGWSGETFELE